MENVYFIDLYTGVFINDFWGTHPVFGLEMGDFIGKTYIHGNYEYRSGKSSTFYDLDFNDTIRRIDNFRNQMLGLEFGHPLVHWGKLEIGLLGGVETNWNLLRMYYGEKHRLGGYGYSAGFSYHLTVDKESGPVVQLRYHYMDLSGDMKTDYNPHSLLIRLMYTTSFASKAYFNRYGFN